MKASSVAFVAFVFAFVTASIARAEDRPFDAPRLAAEARRVPPIPPEYQTEEDGGIRFSYAPTARKRVRPLLTRVASIRTELATLLGRDGVLSSIEIRIAEDP